MSEAPKTPAELQEQIALLVALEAKKKRIPQPERRAPDGCDDAGWPLRDGP